MKEVLKVEDVVSAYSGRLGCACGCRGEHRYSSAHRTVGSYRRGYTVDDDEVKDRSVKVLTNKMNKFLAEGLAEWVDQKTVAFESDTRLYIVSML